MSDRWKEASEHVWAVLCDQSLVMWTWGICLIAALIICASAAAPRQANGSPGDRLYQGPMMCHEPSGTLKNSGYLVCQVPDQTP